MKISIRAIASRDELRVVSGLFAASLPNGHAPDRKRLHGWLETSASCYPGFESEHTRIAVRQKEVLGALRLVTDTIRIGETRLKAGKICWMATADHTRKKGMAGRLLDDAMAYMRTRQYHVAMLFHVPGLHERCGFTAALGDYAIVMDTLEALTFEVPYKTRPARPGDIPALLRLHNAGEAEASCSVVRVAGHFACKWECRSDIHVLLDDQGRAVAYFMACRDGNSLTILESAVSGFDMTGGVVGACARIAADASLSSIRFCAPPFHPLARYLSQFDTRHEAHMGRKDAGMMAIVNLAETLEHLVPEWERRVAYSPARDERTEVTLAVGGRFCCVRTNRGAIDVTFRAGSGKVSLTENELMQLISGHAYVENVLDTRRCIVPPSARALLAAIFPKRAPYVWPFDRF
ncbi:MAG TPA: GNAT family N-acetyltransferase [Candidatus Hydrogenedentes bacterium]|nr:GNAT family N-acetyltransferase [Candidatus Hydrogenedentota bacterium]HOS02461.1 GNAT family N-acetyltransferase [Candidatus Hydrogenedentota bacterium]